MYVALHPPRVKKERKMILVLFVLASAALAVIKKMPDIMKVVCYKLTAI